MNQEEKAAYLAGVLAQVQDQVRVSKLHQLSLLDTPAEAAFDRLTRLACKITNSPVSLVTLVDENRQFFKSQVGLPEPFATTRETALSHSFCQHVVANNEPLIVADARAHPILKDNLAIPDLAIIGYLGIPLAMSDGTCLGSFCIIDHAPRHWSESEIEIVRELAVLTMTEIELRLQISRREQAEADLQQHIVNLDSIVQQRTRELHAAYSRLVEIDQLKAKFIDDMSHELRTPLTALNIYLELLKKGQSEQRGAYIQIVETELQRLGTLVENVTQFARLDKLRLRDKTAPVDMNRLVAEVLHTWPRLTTDSSVQLHFKPWPAPLTTLGNRTGLATMVKQLLHNAQNYTKAGQVLVVTELTTDKSNIVLHVADTGIGIAPDDKPHIFDPFFRGTNTGQTNKPGIGLGLTMVREIVAAHGGQIKVESRLEAGTRFSVMLPAANGTAAATELPSP